MSDLQILANADPGVCTRFACEWIQREARAIIGAPNGLPEIIGGKHYIIAARRFQAKYPGATLKIMEHIGSWPSSERELAALQRVFP